MPLAIAEAFRKGKLGIIDYYKLRNIQADTEMRIGHRRHRRDRPQRQAGS